MFLEVEGKIGPIPQPASSQYRPPQLDTNPNVRKDNATEKRKRAAPTKWFRPSTAPKPGGTAVLPPTTTSKAPDNVKTDAPENRPPPLENAPVHERMSGNLFDDRNWLLPPNYLNNDSKNTTGITSPKPSIKEEPKIGEQSIISPKTEKSGWGPNCPFCKNQDMEDWDDKHQNQLQQKISPQTKMQRPQTRCPQNLQKPDQGTPKDKCQSQTKIHQQWQAEIERLNTKYNLDCFSDPEVRFRTR